MSLRFMDSFDHYVTADLTAKWTARTGVAHTINSGSGRRSTSSLRTTANANYLGKTLDAQATWVLGFALKVGAFAGSPVQVVNWLDAGTVQCSLLVNTDGTLSVVRGTGTAVTGGTSTLALSLATYYFIEFKVTIADSIGANTCKVRVNGVDWLTVATGQDLKATANATANSLNFGDIGGGSLGTADWDDVYVLDGQGSTNNDFLGDCRVDAVLPNGDGSNSQWTPSTGSDHYAVVDETAPNTSDYLSDSTPGNRDTHAFADLPSLPSATIYGAQLNLYAAKDDAGTRQIKPVVKSGATTAAGSAQGLSTGYAYYEQIYETDPNTSAAWTESNLNAAEFGVETV